MYTSSIDYGPGKWQVAPKDKIELQVDFITVEFADKKKKTPVPAANQIAGISGILLVNNKKNYKLIPQIKKKWGIYFLGIYYYKAFGSRRL